MSKQPPVNGHQHTRINQRHSREIGDPTTPHGEHRPARQKMPKATSALFALLRAASDSSQGGISIYNDIQQRIAPQYVSGRPRGEVSVSSDIQYSRVVQICAIVVRCLKILSGRKLKPPRLFASKNTKRSYSNQQDAESEIQKHLSDLTTQCRLEDISFSSVADGKLAAMFSQMIDIVFDLEAWMLLLHTYRTKRYGERVANAALASDRDVWEKMSVEVTDQLCCLLETTEPGCEDREHSEKDFNAREETPGSTKRNGVEYSLHSQEKIRRNERKADSVGGGSFQKSKILPNSNRLRVLQPRKRPSKTYGKSADIDYADVWKSE